MTAKPLKRFDQHHTVIVHRNMKAVDCKCVILTTLIDNANVSMGSSFHIRNYPVQFPNLQRCWIALIVEA